MAGHGTDPTPTATPAPTPNPTPTPTPTQVWPGTAVTSDAELDEYIRANVHSANALAGSCRMGGDGDREAVVDTMLRVRGVESLRVVDASIMPAMPGANPNPNS